MKVFVSLLRLLGGEEVGWVGVFKLEKSPRMTVMLSFKYVKLMIEQLLGCYFLLVSTFKLNKGMYVPSLTILLIDYFRKS